MFLRFSPGGGVSGGCRFVLDASPGTTVIAAVLTALDRLKADFPRLVEDYARHAFKPGQRVLVLPSDAVSEYEGLWSQFPGQFKLRLLGTDTASFRSFPLADVLRLEPTNRLRPAEPARPVSVSARAGRSIDSSNSVPAETTASSAITYRVTCRVPSSRA